MTTPLGWPQADPRALARSPLVNVVWQVRFTPIAEIADGRTALAFQERLGKETTLTPLAAPQMTFQVGGSSMSSPAGVDQTGQGWRLGADDGNTQVLLNTTSMSVETSRYGTWGTHFRPWVESLVTALSEGLNPGVSLRVGMRYVNAIFGAALEREPFADMLSLREVVVPALRGFLADDALNDFVDSYQGRHLLRFRSNLMSQIQNGIITTDNGELGLLLDIDTYSEKTSAFEVEEILHLSDELHETGLAVFQQAVSPDAWASMGPRR